MTLDFRTPEEAKLEEQEAGHLFREQFRARPCGEFRFGVSKAEKVYRIGAGVQIGTELKSRWVEWRGPRVFQGQRSILIQTPRPKAVCKLEQANHQFCAETRGRQRYTPKLEGPFHMCTYIHVPATFLKKTPQRAPCSSVPPRSLNLLLKP